jgi:hypothetical protein
MSPRRNRDSPTPSLASECAPPPGTKRGGHTLLRVRGWGSPGSDDWRKSLALCLLCDPDLENVASQKTPLKPHVAGGGGGGLHGSRTSLPGTMSASLIAPTAVFHPYINSGGGAGAEQEGGGPPRSRHSGAGTPQFRSLAGGGGQFPPLSRSSRGSLSNLSCQVSQLGSEFILLHIHYITFYHFSRIFMKNIIKFLFFPYCEPFLASFISMSI